MARVLPGFNYPSLLCGQQAAKMQFRVALRTRLAVKRENEEAVVSFFSSPTLEISGGNLNH